MRLFSYFPPLAVCIGALLLSKRLLHYFQLESYQFRGFFKTLRRQLEAAALPGLAFAICSFVLLFLAALIPVAAGSTGAAVTDCAVAALLLAAALTLRGRLINAGREKKPFRVTARVKRLMVCLAIVLLGVTALALTLIQAENRLSQVVFSLIPLFLPLWVLLAALLALPVEKLIYELYFRDARKKLFSSDRLIRIGITGSYGKTSVKFILRDMLSQKYNVLATPDSFNTPMGITSVIRSRLTPAHQVFIAEMGARHRQDIRELCRLVHPTVGLLTSVGPQHLDTFHTLDNIKNTKYDLIRALPDDGLAAFADDGGIVTALYQETGKPKLLTGAEQGDAWATDIEVGPQGSSFTLHIASHDPIKCVTPLLGRHNIANIVLCAAVAARLGISDRQLQTAIAQLKPVDHRLKIVSTAGGVTVIDDAFNTNPVSSRAALDVLKMFPPRRIIVTPGMVELGEDEARYNREFGEYMANCADIAFLIGPAHTAPIREGLAAAGFDEANIHTYPTLAQAVEVLNGMTRPGDTVMYENDLPDSYSEGE